MFPSFKSRDSQVFEKYFDTTIFTAVEKFNQVSIFVIVFLRITLLIILATLLS
jgi:hypothetical protein